ncbi:MAG: DUF4111 domain-containing protein [Anaerolineae bacterium]
MSEWLPTPYSELNIVLHELVTGIRGALGDNFVGAYLQGSFAIGGFDLNSDCDFIMVTENELSDDEVEALQDVHGRIFDLEIDWAQHLEGSYFTQETLRTYTRSGTDLWYLNHGSRSLTRDKHCNRGLVRWVVREHGVTLAGPSPKTFIEPVPVEILRGEIIGTIVNWGQEIAANPDEYNNRFYQGYIVLQYCRMLHDLIRGFPGSKRAGAEWVKANLDQSWTALIDRAWNGRPDPARSVRQPADPQDFKDTLRFVAYITDEANRRYGNNFNG